MAETVYAVLLWVDPDGGGDYLAWLDDTHVAQVAGFPGVAWARKVRLEQRADDGWLGVLVLYGFENRAALDAYRQSTMFKGFEKDWRRFAAVFRIERYFGEVDLSL